MSYKVTVQGSGVPNAAFQSPRVVAALEELTAALAEETPDGGLAPEARVLSNDYSTDGSVDRLDEVVIAREV